MVETPSIAQLPNYSAYHGFGFVMVMAIVPMVAMRLHNYVVGRSFHAKFHTDTDL